MPGDGGEQSFSTSLLLLLTRYLLLADVTAGSSLAQNVWASYFSFSLIAIGAAECFRAKKTGCNWWTADGNSLTSPRFLLSRPLFFILSLSLSLSYSPSLPLLRCKAAVIPLMGSSRHSLLFIFLTVTNAELKRRCLPGATWLVLPGEPLDDVTELVRRRKQQVKAPLFSRLQGLNMETWTFISLFRIQITFTIFLFN